MSSYLFLDVSREMCVDYGLVLSYADWIAKGGRDASYWEARSTRLLPPDTKTRVMEAHRAEQDRQISILRGVPPCP